MRRFGVKPLTKAGPAWLNLGQAVFVNRFKWIREADIGGGFSLDMASSISYE